MSSVSYNDDKGDQKIARVHFRCVKESELTCFNPQKVPAVCDYDLVELLTLKEHKVVTYSQIIPL